MKPKVTVPECLDGSITNDHTSIENDAIAQQFINNVVSKTSTENEDYSVTLENYTIKTEPETNVPETLDNRSRLGIRDITEIIIKEEVTKPTTKQLLQNNSVLQKHEGTHKRERHLDCDICGNECASLSALKVHRRTHTGEKPYSCTECNQTFSDKSSLKSHMRQHTDSFIECFKSNRCLWDAQSYEYVDRQKRNAAYSELLKIYKIHKNNSTVADVKRKINTLRSSYRREIKKIKMSETSGCSSNNVYTPSIWWFHKLDFLQDLEKPKEGISTVATSDEEEQISIRSPPKKKQNLQKEMLSAAYNFLKKPSDTYDHLGQVWSNRLREMEPMQKIIAERAINEIIYHGQMQKLTPDAPFLPPSAYNKSYVSQSPSVASISPPALSSNDSQFKFPSQFIS